MARALGATILLAPDITLATCPTANQATYAANRPVRLADVVPNAPGCIGTIGGPPLPLRCNEHVIYVPGAGGAENPDYPHLKDGLFVFLPATGGIPESNTKVLRIAAFAGYRTIGLTYDSLVSPFEQCTTNEPAGSNDCDANYTKECPFEVRWEKLWGEDDPDTLFALGHEKDSIGYRLLHVLNVSRTRDIAADGVNDWHWEQYCDDPTCDLTPTGVPFEWVQRINWERVVVAGFSQGAGFSHPLSLHYATDGIVSIDGGNDRCQPAGGQPGDEIAEYYVDRVIWWGTHGGASWGPGEFGAIHQLSYFENQPAAGIAPQGWTFVQISPAPHDIDVNPLPLTSDQARTDQSWPLSCEEHGSMATDRCLTSRATWAFPRDTAQTSVHVHDAHLFQTYVEGFCNAE